MWGRIISTHALTEGDCHPPERRTLLMKFQLTPSRRATINLPPLALRSLISTHALTEGDRCTVHLVNLIEISTHALTEGDYDCFFCGILRAISTHALTEGDSVRLSTSAPRSISTHALTEGDVRKNKNSRSRRKFQLTPSRRATLIAGHDGL